MFLSIRWRMVASYALLTLVTVSLLGLLVLSLMQRYLERQELAFLSANAEAVAHQSKLFMLPAVKPPALSQLAQTVSLLSDVQVRILDDQKNLLADSGQPATVDNLTWIMSPAKPAQLEETRPSIAIFSRATMPTTSSVEAQPLAAAVQSITIQKAPSLWGSQLQFATTTLVTQPFEAGTVMIAKTPITAALASDISPTFSVAFLRSPAMVTMPIQTGKTVLGYVEMSSGPNFVTEALAAMRSVFLVAGLGVTLLAVLLGLIVSQGLTAPLQGLATATRRMNGGDLAARAPVHSNDEIGIVAQQFNQMAAALESSFTALAAERDALRRFMADASHELRTPITALHTFNELLQGDAAHDPTAQREFLQESQLQLERLARITSGLLDLSRLDGGLTVLTLAEHPLGELVMAVAAPFKHMAEERGLALVVEPMASAFTVVCDRQQIELALTNLLDNALKFTPAGGQIHIGTARQGNEVAIWVKDNGPGIALTEQAHLFKRFYQGRHARGGSGLGLAIVQSIMQAHGGRVAVASALNEGSCFTLTLAGAQLNQIITTS